MKATIKAIIAAGLLAFASLAQAVSPQVFQFAVNAIDAEVNKECADAKVKPNAIINDDQFVRRAYLTIIGRIPTYEEYNKFSKLNSPNKRTELVRSLVNSEGYTSNMYNFWAEQLRLRDRINNTNFMTGAPYIEYIKEQIKSNKPYNTFVKNLLTSKGDYYTNPATGVYERDLGMPLDNLIANSKVFMGIDITCAQCHDDPFQSWTQTNFYQFASMFFQSEAVGRRNPAAREKTKQIRMEIEEIVKNDQKLRGLNNQVNNFLSATLAAVNVEPTKKLKYPFDYRYKDHQPNELVEPKILFGEWPITNKEDMREDAVAWITNPDHPTFTKNIVNRYWGLVFGEPIIARIDNIYDNEKINHPLLVLLEKIFKTYNYDNKMFLQTLCSTQLFQRAQYTGAMPENYVFIGPLMKRLTAEQIWDSCLAIIMDNPEYFHNTNFVNEYVSVMSITDEQFKALKLDDVKAKLTQIQEVNKKKYYGAINYKGYNLIRASEANDEGGRGNTASGTSGILTQLGRSDRELIGTSTREGSVTQVISLLNGQLDDIVVKPDSILQNNLKGKSPGDKLDIVFKTILCRRATVEEKSIFEKASDNDLIWALINTNEFKFTK